MQALLSQYLLTFRIVLIQLPTWLLPSGFCFDKHPVRLLLVYRHS